MIHVLLAHVRPACSRRLGSCYVFHTSHVVVVWGALQCVLFYAVGPYNSSGAFGSQKGLFVTRLSTANRFLMWWGLPWITPRQKKARYIRGISVFVLHRVLSRRVF